MSTPGTASGNVEYTAWAEPSCVAGTAASAYTLTACPINLAWLWRAEFRIPPGHAGLTGIAMVDSGQFIVPFGGQAPAWLIGDDDLLEYPYGKELGSNVAFATYNTDTTYDHGWQVRLIYTPMSALDLDQAVIITPDVAAWLAEVDVEEGA